MNWDQIKGKWKEVSDKIKLTWGKLSEDDITAIAGQRDQFVRLLQERYGYEQDKTESAVDQFAQRLRQCIEYRSHATQSIEKSLRRTWTCDGSRPRGRRFRELSRTLIQAVRSARSGQLRLRPACR